MLNKICFYLAMAGLSLSLFSCGAGLNRFSSVDGSPGGFNLIRSGQPDVAEVEELCKRGVTRIFALNGQAGRYSQVLADKCPRARVVYNQEQDPDTGLPRGFLESFDLAVQDAKASGEGILIHCYCGCHRTGRLAAYYRMKYQGWPAAQAIEEMMDLGKDMDEHPSLSAQVYAMEDHIKGRSCSQKSEYCIR